MNTAIAAGAALRAPDKLNGVEVDWMQSQWRDCADKAAQLAIFRDMTGATVQQILDAVGEPEYVGPIAPAPKRRTYRAWTPEDDEELIRLREERIDCHKIAERLGREIQSVYSRYKKLKLAGRLTVSAPAEVTAEVTAEAEPAAGFKNGSFAEIEREIGEMKAIEAEYEEKLKKVRADLARMRSELGRLLALAGGMFE